MKKGLLIALIFSICLVSCSKDNGPENTDFTGTYYGKWVDAAGSTGDVTASLGEWSGDYDLDFRGLLVARGYDKMERIPCEKGEIARIRLSNESVIAPDTVEGVPFETSEAQNYIPLEYKLYEYKGKKVIESLAPSTSGLRVVK